MSTQTAPGRRGTGVAGPAGPPTDIPLRVNWISIRGCAICRPVGSMDAFSVTLFRQVMGDLAPGTRLILDLSALEFLDSAGLAALLGSSRWINDTGGATNVVAPRDVVRRLLLDTGFSQVTPIFATINEAVDAHLAGTEAAVLEQR